MSSFPEKVASAFADIEKLKAGWVPTEADVAGAVPLEGWWPITHRELRLPSLAGYADHPTLGRQIITTSPVLWLDDRLTAARCLSRWYRLGDAREPLQQVRLTHWDQVEELKRAVETAMAAGGGLVYPMWKDRSADP